MCMESLLLSGLSVHGVTVVFKVACEWSHCCFQGCVCME